MATAQKSASSAAAVMLALLIGIVLVSGAAAGGKCSSPLILPQGGTLVAVVTQCGCGGPTGDTKNNKALNLCLANIGLIRARTYNATCRDISDDTLFIASRCCDKVVAGLPLELPDECSNAAAKQQRNDRKWLGLKIAGGILASLVGGLLVWVIKRWWKSRQAAKAAAQAQLQLPTVKHADPLDV